MPEALTTCRSHGTHGATMGVGEEGVWVGRAPGLPGCQSQMAGKQKTPATHVTEPKLHGRVTIKTPIGGVTEISVVKVPSGPWWRTRGRRGRAEGC
jgi:hypothetical protein